MRDIAEDMRRGRWREEKKKKKKKKNSSRSVVDQIRLLFQCGGSWHSAHRLRCWDSYTITITTGNSSCLYHLIPTMTGYEQVHETCRYFRANKGRS